MIKQAAIAMAMVMTAGTVFAAQSNVQGNADIAFGQSFATLDADGNGMVSWSEAEAHGISESAFHSAETTQDGMLSLTEYQVARNAREGVVGEAAETGEDTAAEAEPMTGEEMQKQAEGMDMADENGMSGDQATIEDSADVAFGQSFETLDTDGNGMVSWSEAKAHGISKSAFHSAETTQDGMLSQTEYQVARNAREGVVGEAAETGEDTAVEAQTDMGTGTGIQ